MKNKLLTVAIILISFSSFASRNDPYLLVCEGENVVFRLSKEGRKLYSERSSFGDYVRNMEYEIKTSNGLKKGTVRATDQAVGGGLGYNNRLEVSLYENPESDFFNLSASVQIFGSISGFYRGVGKFEAQLNRSFSVSSMLEFDSLDRRKNLLKCEAFSFY